MSEDRWVDPDTGIRLERDEGPHHCWWMIPPALEPAESGARHRVRQIYRFAARQGWNSGGGGFRTFEDAMKALSEARAIVDGRRRRPHVSLVRRADGHYVAGLGQAYLHIQKEIQGAMRLWKIQEPRDDEARAIWVRAVAQAPVRGGFYRLHDARDAIARAGEGSR